MAKKMLIDATHSEETRVVVLEDGRLDELDVDTSTKKQIKGNIYLAKVVRVEPSLQAAFVEYGGNRHGFLAFGEIHPDYYQIPVADREALKEQIAAEQNQSEERNIKEASDVEVSSDVETVSEADDIVRHRPSFSRRYKIQEVVRQGQVMLIQVIKEERGNKGAALTTYLSLAGRFSVLMPNNGKGGGVSRKISNAKDRKTLRAIVDKLPIPQGMSVIIRTAGQGKTKTEIKRDFDYLMKTWMRIREKTLESIAPMLIHEEGDIVKRSLRDVFTPDIDEIWVEGESVFKSARDFMKILMPAQAKKIKQYKGDVPLFQEYRVEGQLESIHNNIVQLRSGGYLVIDQTEALVAVDVNSGRATREHDIEETALRTNLETCDEIARQLRLRDLAGLIVIDFIDMDEPRNNAAVERRLKEALKHDRARIQVGKISGFGLMEMSRQRLHSSFLESSYRVCPHCGGKGVIRSTESCAMHALHILEEAGVKNQGNTLILSVPAEIATYVLNVKRDNLISLEKRFQLRIQILSDNTLDKPSDFRLERLRGDGERVSVPVVPPAPPKRIEKNVEKQQPIETPIEEDAPSTEEDVHANRKRRRSRNQRRRDWRRKQKQLAAEQAALNDMRSEHEVEMTDEQVVEATQSKVIEAENFTVVEQASLADVERTDKPKKGRYRDRKKRKAQNKNEATVSPAEDKSVPVVETESSEKQNQDKPRRGRPVKKEEKSEHALVAVETHLPAPIEPELSAGQSEKKIEKPTPKKGGWWNRLMN